MADNNHFTDGLRWTKNYRGVSEVGIWWEPVCRALLPREAAGLFPKHLFTPSLMSSSARGSYALTVPSREFSSRGGQMFKLTDFSQSRFFSLLFVYFGRKEFLKIFAGLLWASTSLRAKNHFIPNSPPSTIKNNRLYKGALGRYFSHIIIRLKPIERWIRLCSRIIFFQLDKNRLQIFSYEKVKA